MPNLTTSADIDAFMAAANDAAARTELGLGALATITPAANVATFLTTPSSANLRAAVTDESGTGVLLFANGALGTPASGVGTNFTGIPISTGLTGAGTGVLAALAVNANAGGGLIVLADPGADRIPFWDDSAGAYVFLTIGTGLDLTATTLTATANANAITLASAAVGAGLLIVSAGADRTAVATDTVTTINATTSTVGALNFSRTLSSDDTYHGGGITGINAGATIAQWEAVYYDFAAGEWLLADANGSSTYPSQGLAVAAGTDGNALTVMTQGIVRNDAWAWSAGPIYLSATAGGLTQTAPSTSGDKVQVVGFAISADVAYFNFNTTYLTVA